MDIASVDIASAGGGREGGGCGSGASGSDYGRLGMAKEPLDGLAVGFVTKLAGELEDAGCADDWHADAAASAVDFRVAVFGRRFFDGDCSRGRRVGLDELLTVAVGGVGAVGVGDGVR